VTFEYNLMDREEVPRVPAQEYEFNLRANRNRRIPDMNPLMNYDGRGLYRESHSGLPEANIHERFRDPNRINIPDAQIGRERTEDNLSRRAKYDDIDAKYQRIKKNYYLPDSYVECLPEWMLDSLFSSDCILCYGFWIPTRLDYNRIITEVDSKTKLKLRVSHSIAFETLCCLVKLYKPIKQMHYLPFMELPSTIWIYHTFIILDEYYYKSGITRHRNEIRDRIIPKIFQLRNKISIDRETEQRIGQMILYNPDCYAANSNAGSLYNRQRKIVKIHRQTIDLISSLEKNLTIQREKYISLGKLLISIKMNADIIYCNALVTQEYFGNLTESLLSYHIEDSDIMKILTAMDGILQIKEKTFSSFSPITIVHKKRKNLPIQLREGVLAERFPPELDSLNIYQFAMGATLSKKNYICSAIFKIQKVFDSMIYESKTNLAANNMVVNRANNLDALEAYERRNVVDDDGALNDFGQGMNLLQRKNTMEREMVISDRFFRKSRNPGNDDLYNLGVLNEQAIIEENLDGNELEMNRIVAFSRRTDMLKGIGDIKDRNELLIYSDMAGKLKNTSTLIRDWNPIMNSYDTERYLELFNSERYHFRKPISYDGMNIVVTNPSTQMKSILISINIPSKCFSNRGLYSGMQSGIKRNKNLPMGLFTRNEFRVKYYYGPLVAEDILNTMLVEGKANHGLLCLILAHQEQYNLEAIKEEDFDLEMEVLGNWYQIIVADQPQEIERYLSGLKDNISLLINTMTPWRFALTDLISDHLRAILFCFENEKQNLKLNWARCIMLDFNISLSVIFLCKLLSTYPCFFIPAYVLDAVTEIFIQVISAFGEIIRVILNKLSRNQQRVLFSNTNLLLERISDIDRLRASFLQGREQKVARHIQYLREQDTSRLIANTAEFSKDINILFMEDQGRKISRATFTRIATYCVYIWR
jgi:hypothetical protein